MLYQLIEGLQSSYDKAKEHYEKLIEEIQRLDAAISSEEQTCLQEKEAKELLKQVNQARENKERLKIAALNAENVVNECKNRIESILAHS